MYARELRAMSDEELLDELEDQRDTLFRLRFQKVSGQLEDPNLIRQTKRNIARLHTIMRERELAAQIAAEEGQD